MTPIRWTIIGAVAVGVFAIRLSFIQAVELADDIPGWAEDLLRLVPPAVLAALVVPDVAFAGGELALRPGNDRLLAGAVGVLVAWRTADIVRTLVVGMGALWVLRFLL